MSGIVIGPEDKTINKIDKIDHQFLCVSIQLKLSHWFRQGSPTWLPTYFSHRQRCSQEACPTALSLKISSLICLSHEEELLPADGLTTTRMIWALLHVKSPPYQINLFLRLLLCTWNFHKSPAKPHPFTLAWVPATHVPFRLETVSSSFPQASTDLRTATFTHSCSAAKLPLMTDQKLSLRMKLSKLEP